MRPIKKGSTDQSVIVRVIDSTDGTPETAVAYNTAGVDLWYRREGGLEVSITEATLAAADSAHSDGGFIHISDGYCRLDLPDAAVATGANGVMVGGTFTGMIVIGCYVPLVDYDPYAALATPTNITAATGITVSAIGANVITAASIADAAIDNATFAADVGSTAYATNIIALAADKAILNYDAPTNTEFIARSLPTADYTIVADLGVVQTADHTASIAAILDDTGTAGVVVAAASKTGYSLSRPTGSVVADAGNSATDFKTDLTSAVNNFWSNGPWVRITSGTLLGQVRKVSAYDGTTKFITVSPGFTATPADGVTFSLVNE